MFLYKRLLLVSCKSIHGAISTPLCVESDLRQVFVQGVHRKFHLMLSFCLFAYFYVKGKNQSELKNLEIIKQTT